MERKDQCSVSVHTEEEYCLKMEQWLKIKHLILCKHLKMLRMLLNRLGIRKGKKEMLTECEDLIKHRIWKVGNRQLVIRISESTWPDDRTVVQTESNDEWDREELGFHGGGHTIMGVESKSDTVVVGVSH